jgi:hypothetical protein
MLVTGRAGRGTWVGLGWLAASDLFGLGCSIALYIYIYTVLL